MGSSQSTKSEPAPSEGFANKPHNVRSSIRTKQPMPDANELERRFTKVLLPCQSVEHGILDHKHSVPP
ncbi:Uncharacterized protein GBIM_06065 [Gryllus bimaculatus]|nr:Uncharacterized protein GBIM_06065 [Gryllus bimaculatus]